MRLEANYAPPQGKVSATVTKGPYQQTGFAGRIALNGGQRVTLDRLRLQQQDLVWENDGPVEVARTAQGDLRIQRFNLRSRAQRLSVEGGLAQNGTLGVDVRAAAPDRSHRASGESKYGRARGPVVVGPDPWGYAATAPGERDAAAHIAGLAGPHAGRDARRA